MLNRSKICAALWKCKIQLHYMHTTCHHVTDVRKIQSQAESRAVVITSLGGARLLTRPGLIYRPRLTDLSFTYDVVLKLCYHLTRSRKPKLSRAIILC
jgi:hypothetical protein